MSISSDMIKELAIRAMKEKTGSEDMAKAFGFLMFGGFGVPGVVDGAKLASAADKIDEAGQEFTEDVALSLVSDVAKATLAESLEAAALTVLEEAGITAEAVASMSVLIVTGLLDSTPIAPEPEPTPEPEPEPTPTPGGGEGGGGGE
ncbi:hypothetical protein [Candidatus Magnetomonas plexicatena]|uniref:hypothetical protein n=1 Tax=Candidatus Magnetomonas plexicatena TaxID=2552947 RepID=UPI001C7924CC|nr:hypothetical protein E2O03_010625 [Nitrospirales bacterium LBB_01]